MRLERIDKEIYNTGDQILKIENFPLSTKNLFLMFSPTTSLSWNFKIFYAEDSIGKPAKTNKLNQTILSARMLFLKPKT